MNTSLAEGLGNLATSFDDLMIRLDPPRGSAGEVADWLAELDPDHLPAPAVTEQCVENMKFANCLPPELALEVARRRLVDPAVVRRVLGELEVD